MYGKFILYGLLVSLPYMAHANGSNINTNQQSESHATNEANQQNITFNSAPAPSETTTKVDYSGGFKTVPNVYAPAISSTAPCIVGWSGGVSALGGGFAVGSGKEDAECTRRETARFLYQFGEAKGAVALLCRNAEVRAAMPQRCEEADLPDEPKKPEVKEVIKEVVKEVPVVKYVHAKPKPKKHVAKPVQCKPCTK